MKRVTKSKFFLPLVVVLVAVVVTALLVATKPQVEEKKDEFPPLAVQVIQASMDEAERASIFQGAVRAKTNIELVTQVAGKIVRVSDNYIEGGQFQSGEEIVKIDDADFLVAYRSAEAAVAEAKVQLDIELASAATNATEWRDLQGNNLQDASPLRLNKPQVERARARLNAAHAELAFAKLNLDRTSISAPFAGRVMTKGGELGQFVSRGASIGRVFATAEMEVRIPMTDSQIADLGLVVGQNLNAEDSLAAIISVKFGSQLHQWPGHLRGIDASIDDETRLLFATVVADQINSKTAQQGMPLAPGLFVDVELMSSERVAGVKVPRTALRNGDQIYVVEDGKLRFRSVKTVYTSPDIAILQAAPDGNVSAGEMVVVSPVPGAFEGMSVEVKMVNAETETALTPEAVLDASGESQGDQQKRSEQGQI